MPEELGDDGADPGDGLGPPEPAAGATGRPRQAVGRCRRGVSRCRNSGTWCLGSIRFRGSIGCRGSIRFPGVAVGRCYQAAVLVEEAHLRPQPGQGAALGAALDPLDPVTVAAQPKRRQGDVPAPRSVHRRPVHTGPSGIQPGERGGQRHRTGLAAGQRRDDRAAPLPAGHRGSQWPGQSGMRSDLNEDRILLGEQPVGRRPEQHRLPDIAAPVGGVGDRCGRLRVHARRQRELRGFRSQAGEQFFKLVPVAAHHRTVERVVDAEACAAGPGAREPADRPLHRLLRSGDHYRARPVHRRHAYLARARLQRRAHLVSGKLNRGHPPCAAGLPHDLAATHDEPDRVLDPQGTRGAGRRDLSHAVAEHRVRDQAPRRPQPGQRQLHREDGGLGDLGLHQPARRGAPDLRQERPAAGIADDLVALVQ